MFFLDSNFFSTRSVSAEDELLKKILSCLGSGFTGSYLSSFGYSGGVTVLA